MENVEHIMSDLIDLPANQMRKEIDRDELYDMAESIKLYGLINPITVRKKGDRYELVAGQRRLLACGIARVIRIPCVVRELDDATALDIMATENLERRDVNPVDESNHIALTMEHTKATVDEMARRLNRSPKYIQDRLLIAEMPDYLQEFLRHGEIKIGAAILLMEIEPDEKRRVWAGLAVQNNSSIREVEYWVYQHRLKTLPEVVNSASDIPNAPLGEQKEVMFTCAVDGKPYPATECQAVFVHKSNITYLEAFRAELGRDPVLNSAGGGLNPSEAAIAAS